MYHTFDQDFTIRCFEKLVNIPSPVGYYVEMNPVIQELAASLGYEVAFDNKSTAYITLEGQDNSKTVMVGAHLDTVGLVVRRIAEDGTIRIRLLGSPNLSSLEGETVRIHTREGKTYTGLMTCQAHSIHVFKECRTMERNEDNMMILLDEKVSSKEDVVKLGIRHGDPISPEPRCQFTESGFLKSRFIDDKAAVACCFTMLKYLSEHQLRPKYRTILAFPYGEEVGIGGSYVPDGVSEFVALDIGLIGPDCDGNEYAVSICAEDNRAPYDYELTSRLIRMAEKLGLRYAVDTFFMYGTDADAAIKGGSDLKTGAFGMAVYCSHGMERTHIEGIHQTIDLLIAYVLGED